MIQKQCFQPRDHARTSLLALVARLARTRVEDRPAVALVSRSSCTSYTRISSRSSYSVYVHAFMQIIYEYRSSYTYIGSLVQLLSRIGKADRSRELWEIERAFPGHQLFSYLGESAVASQRTAFRWLPAQAAPPLRHPQSRPPCRIRRARRQRRPNRQQQQAALAS